MFFGKKKKGDNIRIINLYEKPIEVMTEEERDQYFLSFSGKTYQEFCDECDRDKNKDQ